jgi:hypothetical protein
MPVIFLAGWYKHPFIRPPAAAAPDYFARRSREMPLKIRVKPEQKFFAGGAVLKNVGTKPADLLVLSDSPVLREDYMMNIDRSEESDAATIYFLLQMIYLFKGKGKPLDALVIETIDKFRRHHRTVARRRTFQGAAVGS